MATPAKITMMCALSPRAHRALRPTAPAATVLSTVLCQLVRRTAIRRFVVVARRHPLRLAAVFCAAVHAASGIVSSMSLALCIGHNARPRRARCRTQIGARTAKHAVEWRGALRTGIPVYATRASKKRRRNTARAPSAARAASGTAPDTCAQRNEPYARLRRACYLTRISAHIATRAAAWRGARCMETPACVTRAAERALRRTAQARCAPPAASAARGPHARRTTASADDAAIVALTTVRRARVPRTAVSNGARRTATRDFVAAAPRCSSPTSARPFSAPRAAVLRGALPTLSAPRAAASRDPMVVLAPSVGIAASTPSAATTPCAFRRRARRRAVVLASTDCVRAAASGAGHTR